MPSDQRTIAACPYCLCAIQPGATEPKDLPYACPGCQYRYHAGCYQELGGCAIDGRMGGPAHRITGRPTQTA